MNSDSYEEKQGDVQPVVGNVLHFDDDDYDNDDLAVDDGTLRSPVNLEEVIVDEEAVVRGMRIKGDLTGMGLRIGHVNMNGAISGREMEIILRMKIWKLDMFFLVDTRLNEKESSEFSKRAQSLMREVYDQEGARVLVSPHYDGDRRDQKVGGMAVVIAPSLIGLYINFRKCCMDLGVIMELNIRKEEGHLNVVGTYWPSKGPGVNSLKNKIRRWMKNNGKMGNPRSWMQYAVSRIITTSQERGEGVVVLGDLNCVIERDEPGNCHAWVQENGLTDLTDSMARTTGLVRKIDHILGWNVGVYNSGYDASGTRKDLSDHASIWAELKLEVPSRRLNKRDIRVPSLSLKTEKEWSEYEEAAKSINKGLPMGEIMKKLGEIVREIREGRREFPNTTTGGRR